MGVDILYYTQGNIDYSSRWLARGLVTAAVIYAFAETSGAHVDPAVTLGFWIRRVFPAAQAAAYVVAQFAGALAAGATWLSLAGPSAAKLGVSHPGPAFTPFDALCAEIICTFALVLTILMTAQNEPAVEKQAALAVGFMVAACGFVAGPISGASMNPARTIAPQLLTGTLPSLWVYVVGPSAGSILAVAAHALLFGPPTTRMRKNARGA
jgi:aquaporin Z